MINHGQPNQYSSAAEKILEPMCRFVENKTKKRNGKVNQARLNTTLVPLALEYKYFRDQERSGQTFFGTSTKRERQRRL